MVRAVPKDASGRVLTGRVATWSSSDPTRVRITPPQGTGGELIAGALAVGVGEATISVTVEGTKGEARITASLHPAQTVGVWPDTSRIPVSERRVLRVQRFSGINREPIAVAGGTRWESSDPSIAAVDNSGTVTAVGEGDATITAVFPERQIRAEVFVFRYESPLEFASVTAGDRHACGLTTAGVAYCWGHNDYGQLGVDAPMDRCARFLTAGGGIFPQMVRWFRCSEAPVRVNTPLRFASISAGRRQSCAITASGRAYCWGRNVGGATGTGLADTIVRAPTPVGGNLTFRTIDVGNAGQACGVTTSNEAYCWGSNVGGALGNGSEVDSPVPTRVAGGHAWRDVRAGATACGITTDEIPYCWGSNSSGQVGVAPGNPTTSPARVAGDLRFKQIGASCGLVADGSVYCWGRMAGGVVTHTPTLISGGTLASLARGHRCGVTADGIVNCWWLSVTDNTPVRFVNELAVSTVDVGAEVACALDLSAAVYCAHRMSFWNGDAVGGIVSSGPVTMFRVAGQK